MKRFHVHLHVEDLQRNIAFYTALFNQQPSRVENDYAKWMLADPPVNFAISTRGSRAGIDHLGIQVESDEELQALKAQAQQADMALRDEGQTTCCYARSDKYWLTDPQGIAWEQFHTLENIPVFRAGPAAAGALCCAPATAPAAAAPAATEAAVSTACCAPRTSAAAQACCAPTPTQRAQGASSCC